MTSRWTIGIAGAVLGALLALAGVRAGLPGLAGPDRPAPQEAASKPGESEARSETGASPLWLDPDEVVAEGGEIHSRFAQLAQQAAPAVVNVHTSKTVVQAFPDLPFPDIFREFFGGMPPFGDPQAPQRPQRREFRIPSLGTGFVISKDGYIVTNHHVIEDVDEIEVRFLDGDTAKAEVVGEDPKTDLALIRVEGVEDLHVLPLGDSDAILPGDWVVAIGNPFGLNHTVTVGIVSAKGRELGQGPYDDFIQTDAAINPGNSGGPLLNLRGEVVGINTAINPQANTIGFAVPSNLAKSILPQLRETGHVVRGWLGVAVQPVTKELQEAFELPAARGALVSHVSPGSPAEKAGIERGDVILRFDGEEVAEMRDLPQLVAQTPVGSKVEVEVQRSGKRRTLEVEVGELEASPPRAAGGASSGLTGFGLRVEDLTPTLQRRYGIEQPSGVVVTRVEPGGPAAGAGIREGDVLLEVNRKPIETAADLTRALEGADSALLLLARGELNLYVPLERRDRAR